MRLPIYNEIFNKHPLIQFFTIIISVFAVGFSAGNYLSVTVQKNQESTIKNIELENKQLIKNISDLKELNKIKTGSLADTIKKLEIKHNSKISKLNDLSGRCSLKDEVVAQQKNDIESLTKKNKSLSIAIAENNKTLFNMERELKNEKQKNRTLENNNKNLNLILNPDVVLHSAELSDNDFIIAFKGTLKIQTNNDRRYFYFSEAKSIETNFILTFSNGKISKFNLVLKQKMEFEHMGQIYLLEYESFRREDRSIEGIGTAYKLFHTISVIKQSLSF